MPTSIMHICRHELQCAETFFLHHRHFRFSFLPKTHAHTSTRSCIWIEIALCRRTATLLGATGTYGARISGGAFGDEPLLAHAALVMGYGYDSGSYSPLSGQIEGRPILYMPLAALLLDIVGCVWPGQCQQFRDQSMVVIG